MGSYLTRSYLTAGIFLLLSLAFMDSMATGVFLLLETAENGILGKQPRATTQEFHEILIGHSVLGLLLLVISIYDVS